MEQKEMVSYSGHCIIFQEDRTIKCPLSQRISFDSNQIHYHILNYIPCKDCTLTDNDDLCPIFLKNINS